MKRLTLILVLILCSCVWGDVIKYVDPDATGGATGDDWANA